LLVSFDGENRGAKMVEKAHIFRLGVGAAARIKKRREEARSAVRSQQAPEGESLVFGYLSKKKGRPAKGYESWLVTEMPEANNHGWRHVRVRVDYRGTCRFDLTWNGERFAGCKALDDLQERHPGLAKTALSAMQSHEAMRNFPR
jgi:hypothetical protein